MGPEMLSAVTSQREIKIALWRAHDEEMRELYEYQAAGVEIGAAASNAEVRTRITAVSSHCTFRRAVENNAASELCSILNVTGFVAKIVCFDRGPGYIITWTCNRFKITLPMVLPGIAVLKRSKMNIKRSNSS
ncbi:hypothetical protein C5167_042693 [Papaver somniferum]|uniref:Uncharacterized protein n=1 Tax=Papaver somniferum TaxID=3469 RepID=A0A4Y7L597_PAPSO|nr:hypothetical protein C5167_042693 [Papaver somniferum]